MAAASCAICAAAIWGRPAATPAPYTPAALTNDRLDNRNCDSSVAVGDCFVSSDSRFPSQGPHSWTRLFWVSARSKFDLRIDELRRKRDVFASQARLREPRLYFENRLKISPRSADSKGEFGLSVLVHILVLDRVGGGSETTEPITRRDLRS